MIAFAWLAMGAVIGAGHWAAAALPAAGGACLILAALAAVLAVWAIRREKQLERIAGGLTTRNGELPMSDTQQAEPEGPKCFLCGAAGVPMTGDPAMGTTACIDEEPCLARSRAATDAILAEREGW